MCPVTNLKKKKMTPCTQKQRIEEIERKLNLTNDAVIRIEVSAKRIEMSVVGDKDAGIEGMAHRVERHGRLIATHNRILWIGSGIALVISGAWIVFAEFHK